MKILFFSTSNFQHFFSDFCKICSIWGGSGASKNLKKLKKIAKNRVRAAFGIHLKLKAISEAIFEGFWLDFLRFWTDLGRIFSIFGGG